MGERMQFDKFQKIIGYTFKNPSLLTQALTHPSLAHEKNARSSGDNQRLEFLGDAVLQLTLTDLVYHLYPDQPEGILTQHRAHLANRHSLCRRAKAIELGKYLLLGKGEEISGGRERLSNLADAYEALLGALYLDGGIRAARKFILAQFDTDLKELKQRASTHNPKGRLQELLQSQAPVNPVYRVVAESGPDHSKHFEVVVFWQNNEIGRGRGPSKKQAETVAAEAALASLLANQPELLSPPSASP
jgi:ribonuclease-3